MKVTKLRSVMGLKVLLSLNLTVAVTLGSLETTRADEDELYEASQTLIELKKELRAEKSRRINDKIDSYNRRKDLEAQIRSREREIEDLRILGLKLENEVLELNSKKEEITREVEGLEGNINEIKNFIIGKFEQLRAKGLTLFPSRSEEKMVRLKELSEKYKPDESNIIEGLHELIVFIRDEIASGETLEIYPGTVKANDGIELKARILRIGRIASLFLSSQDDRVGILLKREGTYQWEEGLSETTQRKIKEIFKSASRKNPGLLAIPLDITQGRRSTAEVETGQGVTSYLIRGGPIMIPLILVGLIALIMIGERILFLRKNRIEAVGLMNRLSGYLQEKKYPEAKEFLAGNPGALARVLGHGLARIERGRETVQEAIEEAILSELPPLKRFLSAIGIMGSISPLLGLLGTVSGMISTFNVITRFGSGDPKLLSGGISEALITTEVGLAIAIPVLLLHNYLSNRVEEIISKLEEGSAKFINLVFP
jgi:biopolymer transport protein ExbB